MKNNKYFNIDIKPGNIFYVHDINNNELFFIVFPTKQNLNVIGVDFTYIKDLNSFYNDYYDYIVKIYDGMNNGSLLEGNIIWSKTKIKLTKKEIAEKFGYSEDIFEIV